MLDWPSCQKCYPLEIKLLLQKAKLCFTCVCWGTNRGGQTVSMINSFYKTSPTQK